MLFKIKWKHMEKNVHSTFQKILMKKKSEEKSGFFFYNFDSESSKTCEIFFLLNKFEYIYKYNM